MVPRFRTTTFPEMVAKPCDGLTARIPTLVGRTLEMIVPEAADGPRFVSEMLYVSVWPTSTGLGAASRPTARSAKGGLTCETTVTLLLEGSNSWLLEVTVAVEL